MFDELHSEGSIPYMKHDYILSGWNGLDILILFAVVGVLGLLLIAAVKVARNNSRRRKMWRDYEKDCIRDLKTGRRLRL